MTKSNFSAGRKRRFACDYVPKDHEARAYAQFVRQNFEPWDWDEIINKPCRKPRGLSLARAITQAKKSGVDVIVDRGDGTRFTFRQSEPDASNISITPIDSSEWN